MSHESSPSTSPGDQEVASVYTDVPHWDQTEAERRAGEGAERDGRGAPGTEQ